jgi:hypothetical protein
MNKANNLNADKNKRTLETTKIKNFKLNYFIDIGYVWFISLLTVSAWFFAFSTILAIFVTWVLITQAYDISLVDIAITSIGMTVQYTAFALHYPLSVGLLGANPPHDWSVIFTEQLQHISWMASIFSLIPIVVLGKRIRLFDDVKQ